MERIEASNLETKKVILQPIMELQAKEFLTIQETCKLLGISRTTLWRILKQGKLKSAKIGSRVIIRKEDLNSLFN